MPLPQMARQALLSCSCELCYLAADMAIATQTGIGLRRQPLLSVALALVPGIWLLALLGPAVSTATGHGFTAAAHSHDMGSHV